MTATEHLLQVRDVVKDFGGVRAVDHCSFDVMPGTITGLIGPNGRGQDDACSTSYPARCR